MKKIQIITAISAIAIFQACQQPAPDAATIDAKVAEAYEAEKMKIENEAATACEDAINAKVKALKDSFAAVAESKKMSAQQAAAALAKKQAALKAKAAADAKKRATAKKANPVKTPEQVKKETITKEINEINKRVGDEREVKPAPQKEIDAINDRVR